MNRHLGWSKPLNCNRPVIPLKLALAIKGANVEFQFVRTASGVISPEFVEK